MAVPFIQTAFSAGEITPSLFGHVDLARFHVGASTMRNCFVSYRGGAYSRAGTAFVGYSKQTGRAFPPRLITFQFSINQGRALEFGNHYMRVIENGAFVTENATNITGITQANPGVVTDAAHGYANGDWVFLSGIGGMTPLNGRTLIVANVTTNTYTLTDVFGNAINTTAYPAYTAGGTAARIYTLVTPWAEADLAYLKFTQSADVVSICCWNQITNTEYQPQDLSRLADDDWTLTAVNPTPTIAAPATCSASASAAGSTDFQYVVTAVNPADGSESIASPIGNAPNSVDIATTAGAITVNWAGVGKAQKYFVYKASPVFNGTVPAGAIFGYAGTAFGTQFVDNNVTPDFTQVPLTHINPFAPGQIESVNITNGGSGLSAVTFVVTTATGSGFAGYPVVVGGVMTAFVITDSGENYAQGDSIAFNGAGYATGSITFAANPSNNDTITLNGVVWTFKTAITGANQTMIQPTVGTTMTQLASDLAASSNASLTVASYVGSTSGVDGVLTIRFNTAGTAGNAYTLAASVAMPSGPNLTGGSGTSGTNPVATLTIGPNSGTYPSAVAYFQQRRVYASSPNEPDTYWMSQPGAFLNFDQRDPTISSDAITGDPWSLQVNGIQWMVSMPGGLVVLTGLQAWQLTGTGGSSLNPQPITPSTQQAQPQAYNGASPTVPPIQVEFDIIYVQAKGSIVRDLSYNFFVNIYTGTDITIISSHLFTGYQIVEWAWTEEPYKLIWAVRNDGILLSDTFLKPESVNGWGRHDTNGLFQSVCSVTEPPVDALYLAVQRSLNGAMAYMIERMDDRLWGNVEEVWAVDAGLQFPQPAPNATLTASSSTGLGAINSITGLVGGQNYSPQTTASIVDLLGNGAGAQLGITIGAEGAVTAINVVAEGAGYLFPLIVITDPTNAGSDASANAVLDNSTTFTASSNVFSAGSVGQVIRVGGGIAAVTAYTSPTEVTANIVSPIVEVYPNSGGIPVPQPANDWTMTAPTNVISGLWHLVGATVTGLADGVVIPPTVVTANGTINLENAASAVTVGLGFQAQLQSVYLDVGNPTVQGQRKKIGPVTARIELSRQLKIGANQPDGSVQSPPQIAPTWRNLQNLKDGGTAPYQFTITPTVVAPQPLWTGDSRIPVPGGFQTPGQVCVQQDYPLPVQVLAFVPEVLPGDLSQLSSGSGKDRREAA